MPIKIRASLVLLGSNKINWRLQKTKLVVLVVYDAKLQRTCEILFRKKLYIFNVSVNT